MSIFIGNLFGDGLCVGDHRVGTVCTCAGRCPAPACHTGQLPVLAVLQLHPELLCSPCVRQQGDGNGGALGIGVPWDGLRCCPCSVLSTWHESFHPGDFFALLEANSSVWLPDLVPWEEPSSSTGAVPVQLCPCSPHLLLAPLSRSSVRASSQVQADHHEPGRVHHGSHQKRRNVPKNTPTAPGSPDFPSSCRGICALCVRRGAKASTPRRKAAINPAGRRARLLPSHRPQRPGAVWQARAPSVIGRSDGAEI